MMEPEFSPMLVTLSIGVAIFASYVALNLAHSVTQTKGQARAVWLACGALAMGIGIWSMHFIGMIAFEMPGMVMAYDLPLMILSVGVAIGASGLAFYIVSHPVVPLRSILSSGVAMAAAIAGMHYIGMDSMRMAATIEWNMGLVVLSVVIALLASFGALLILIRLRDKEEQFREIMAASTVMGLAISGMHYTGMYAATFIHQETSPVASDHVIVSSWLATVVVIAPLIVLGLALASSKGHRLIIKRSRKAREILGRSEEKFRRLVEAVKDYAIFMLDAHGRVTTWNSGAERITGYAESEIIGKHVSIFYGPGDTDQETADRELAAARISRHFESEGLRVRKDGSRFWASVVTVPLTGPDGTCSGFSTVTRDITQFKETEARMKQLHEELEQRVRLRTQSLEQREKQLRTIANAVPVLIAQLDKDERVLFANETFCRWFYEGGASADGKSMREILGNERYLKNETFIRKVLAGELTTYEKESRSGRNTAIMSITFVPEFNAESQVTGFIIVASDITRHKAIQAELERAKEAAEVANATKSAFLANMSHEIRTPLGAVLGFSELLITGELSAAEQANYMEIIRRNGQLLSNIINDILDLSKVEAGKLEIERSDVSLGEILQELTSIPSLEAGAKGIELKVTAEGVIPQQIKTDALRLRQILLNIVGNAIKFTHKGRVTVRVKLQPAADGSMKLAFIVTDTGAGIHPDQAGRIFAPFSQADVSTTRKFGGTGLGLALSKKLAQSLGGDLVLSASAPGQGSTFTITIDPGMSETVLFQSTEPPPQGQLIPMVRLAEEINFNRLDILVVDDSTDNQALIQRILTVLGAQVVTANNGLEAVEKALNGNFNLVLMDIQMPVMDGYEAVRILRERDYKKPIIALTAHAMKEEHARSLRSGFDAHLTKPIDRKLLVKTLARFVT